MSSNKKGQVSIKDFFKSSNKRTLSERENSNDDKSNDNIIVQEINYKTPSHISNNHLNSSNLLKKKKIIDDEDYEFSYNSLIKSNNGDYSITNEKERNSKSPDDYCNSLYSYKSNEPLSVTKKNFNTENEITIETPAFNKRTSVQTVSNVPAFEGKVKPTKKISNKNKKGDDSDDSESVISQTTVNQNASPEENLPSFLRYENVKDLNGKRPDDPDYDSTTLYVPETFLKKQTPTQYQFWTIKMHNFDKVLFFKLGKFYELFYDDAIIGNRILDLNWMGSDIKKLHVGFPEKNLEEKAAVLVEQGFKVAVIEQTETPEELEARNTIDKTKDKSLKRELCNVFTKGTFSQTNNNSNSSAIYANKYCIALVNLSAQDLDINQESKDIQYYFGFVLFDVSTLDFYVGEIQEDETYNKIQSIFYTIKPEEVIYFRNNLPSYIENFIKSLSSKPLISIRKNDFNLMKSYHIVREYFGDDQDKWDPMINRYILDKRYSNISGAFYLSINFLKNLLLSETIKVAKFYEYSEGIISKSSLIMDYQAIYNLELLETSLDPKKPECGSFVEYMNRCSTPFGKRLMKKWILNPLTDVNLINDRLDIVEDFIRNYDLLTRLRNSMVKMPDFERSCGRIYKSATQRSSKAVYFEDISKHKLNEFFSLLEDFKKSTKIFSLFNEFNSSIGNKKLKRMTKFENEININSDDVNGMVPNILDIVDEFQNIFKHKKHEKETIVEPQEGVDEEYDEYKRKIGEIEKELMEVLERERRKFKCNLITFAHTKFFRYELEIPEEIVSGDKRPKNYKLTTNKKGFHRFHTPELEKLVIHLEEAENNLKLALKNINTAIFKRFYLKHQILSNYINILAELDCLANLAIISSQADGIMTRPKFILSKDSPILELENMRHPVLSGRISNFVANNTIIGHRRDNQVKTSILVTGPNMGGKSTILRQTCIAVIMAQMGCYVPAEKCVLSIVDRIFTRIGARDRILEGKSTFFIEMEETKTIIDHATINSLVIMDELGRGTSTNEGMVIAKSILYFITNKIHCRNLFTTHYHDLVDNCRNFKEVDLYHMDCFVDDNSQSVNFLYKFIQGICPKSYGINVARLAGIKESILKTASKIAEKFRNAKKSLI